MYKPGGYFFLLFLFLLVTKAYSDELLEKRDTPITETNSFLFEKMKNMNSKQKEYFLASIQEILIELQESVAVLIERQAKMVYFHDHPELFSTLSEHDVNSLKNAERVSEEKQRPLSEAFKDSIDGYQRKIQLLRQELDFVNSL